MNWDNQLNSVLSVADGSVSKMRERLVSPGKFSKGHDLFPVRERIHDLDLDPSRVHCLCQPSSSLSSGVQWADVAAVQSQLQIQGQAIESLTQKLHLMERERQSQQCHIKTLQEEVHKLREELREMEQERDEARRGQSPGAERRMEQWRREVERELSSLRGHITRVTSLGNLDESFNLKLCREELEHLQREVDQLKTRLRRQEEDMFLQHAEARESRRQYEHSCKSLEGLADRYRTHSSDLAKSLSECSLAQQDVHQLRTALSEVKDEVRSLLLRERQPTALVSEHTLAPGASQVPTLQIQSRGIKAEEIESDLEDFSPTPSLAEVSSDDLSWLDDKDTVLQQKPRARLSIQSRRSDFAGLGSDQEEDDGENDGDDLFDDDVNPDSGSDLSLNDL
ncbi:myosin heavy chain, non-muscle [Thalassophryne amazonica]|uniref:myosin heavy chain, non-muscle n=1 Tax=Thalassophryne amazonica TaxID=390379 RepID=UPI001471A71A|nr:myosin heavy chain, non-muscle [Thalassophryne amazonica]